MPRGGPSRTKRISDAEREKIAEALRDDPNVSRVAQTFGRGKATVSRIAREAGISTERSKTKHATEAKKADNENAFELLKERLITEANKALDELHAPTLALKWHEGVLIQQEVDEPTFVDKRHIMFRANGAVQYALAIEHRTQGDDDTSQAAVNEWMQSIREEAERRAADA